MELNHHVKRGILLLMVCLAILILYHTGAQSVRAGDLNEVKKHGVLRHLGVPYAHFVRQTPKGEYDGLDVEVIKAFAAHLGVRYQFVSTTWDELFTDLTGLRKVENCQEFKPDKAAVIKGDIIANGLTVLPWRQKIVNYSLPTFPTGVWLVAQVKSSLVPIVPSGDISVDIRKTKSLLKGRSVLTMDGTCLAAASNNLEQTQAEIRYFTQSKTIDDILPAMLNGMAETTLLDIPDAMVALEKWPGEIKIIGPISENQLMGVAVSKSSPELLREFNEFFKVIWKNGTYRTLVEKYYPSVFLYFNDFFDQQL